VLSGKMDGAVRLYERALKHTKRGEPAFALIAKNYEAAVAVVRGELASFTPEVKYVIRSS
jgi:hypothetical protein